MLPIKLIISILVVCTVRLPAESITNDLLSTTLGSWTLGSNEPTNGAPEATPPSYYDADYVVVPVGTDKFTWEIFDRKDGSGAFALWIYDPAYNVENVDVGYPEKGPYWGLKSGTTGHSIVVGIFRTAAQQWNQGYSVWNTALSSTYFWFKDGARGSNGVPFTAGWYKWIIEGTFSDMTFTMLDVDYLKQDSTGNLQTTHGNAAKTYDQNMANGSWAETFGFGWNGLDFKGDDMGGVENIYIAEVGGDGIFRFWGPIITNNKINEQQTQMILDNNYLISKSATLHLKTAQSLKVTLLNLEGTQRVSIADKLFPSGQHSISWKHELNPGVYFISIKGDNYSVFEKVLVIE